VARVLALHGQPGSGRCFDVIARFLGTGVSIVAPDRPGWGTSNDRPVDLLAQVAWVRGYLSEPTTLLGYSLGGALATLVAATYPELVRGVVLVAPAVGREALLWVDRILGMPGVGHLVGGLVAAAVERSPARALELRPSHAFVVEQRSLLDHLEEVEAARRSLPAPTVVVAGRRDRVVPARATLALLEEVPTARLVLVDAGHDVLERAPGVVAACVREVARNAQARARGRGG
jgi:pimeloyl-ACP methyl ester carboxylesterase